MPKRGGHHASRDAASKSFADYRVDPDWIKARAASEARAGRCAPRVHGNGVRRPARGLLSHLRGRRAAGRHGLCRLRPQRLARHEAGSGWIVRRRDTDGDGQADQFTDFAAMDSPRGLLAIPGPDGNGVDLFVMHPSHLSVCRDADGDGVAETSTVLVRALGLDLSFRGADHTTDGIRRGIAGWISVAVKDCGFAKAAGSDGRTVRLRGGGIVRVRPDGSELEIVSCGQRNIFDVTVSPRLDLFTLDNTNDGGGWDKRLSHVPHGGQMGYPSLFAHFADEIVKPMIDDDGGGPTGSLFVEEPPLPAGLSSALFTCCGDAYGTGGCRDAHAKPRTTPRGLPGPGSWPGRARSFPCRCGPQRPARRGPVAH